MGAQLSPMGRGGGRRKRAPMSEINVTPFVDVMLVLLIIFMVTAPLLSTGVQVDLPKTAAKPLAGQDEPVEVKIDRQGRVYVMSTEVGMDELMPKLAAITQGAQDQRIFVSGDQAINYGRVLEVMSLINAAGYNKVALRAQPQDGRPQRR